MNREATWGVSAVIALAAAVGISTQSIKSPGDSAGKGQVSQKSVQPAPTGTKRTTGKACSDAEEMLQSFLLTGEENVAAPASCYDPGPVPPPTPSHELQNKASHLKFVIATLPDPLHTHFSLLFDRSAEAIQQAAQDEGYEYDSSWLPWETEEHSFTHLIDQDAIDDRKNTREDQPGIVVFRKKYDQKSSLAPSQQPFQEGLVVFIVGEEATRGIHRRQFQNAAAWIDALQPRTSDSPPIHILGPTFSGSLPSLAELLADDKVHQFLKYQLTARWTPDWQVRVYSGSVTGRSAAEDFGTDTGKDPHVSGWHVSFHSFVESDDTVLTDYCDYLKNIGLQTNSVAVISEDETAYGNGLEPQGTGPQEPDHCQGAIYLVYPRDISALRAAYQTQSIFSSNASQQSADTQRRNLPSDLADPAGETHDTIRSYGGNQTPLSQEAQLLGIVSVLRANRAQYLLIRSSNMLDPLFLANFFRRAYPEGRVVIRGSDLLFQRERGSTGISGVMMLSTYPLFPWDWTNWPNLPISPNHASHRAFGEDLVEGTYVAARFLLHEPSALGDNITRCSSLNKDQCFLPANLSPKSLMVPGYAAPSWTVPASCSNNPTDSLCKPYLRPATWLSVLGRDNFYPLAAFTKTDAPPSNSYLSGERVRMPLSMKLCLLFILVFGGIHATCCSKASFTAKPAFRAHFATTRDWCPYGQWQHFVLVSVGSILIAFLALVAGWGCGGFYDVGNPLPNSYFIRGFLLLAMVIAFLSILGNNSAVKRLEEDSSQDEEGCHCRSTFDWLRKRNNWSRLLFVVAIAGFLLTFVLPLELKLTSKSRVPTYWRSINLTSGVSPAVPFLSLFAGLYAWFWCSLHGLALFGLDRPRLPLMSSVRLRDKQGQELTDKNKKPLTLLRMFSREDAGKTEEAAIPLERCTRYVAAVLFFLLGAVGYAIARQVPLRSLGADRYGFIFCLWLDLCFSLLLAESWQLWHTWTGLKQLLTFLNRIAIRRAMRALGGFSWGNVWKMSGNVLEVRYKLVSRQIESLSHLNSSFDHLAKVPPVADVDNDAVIAGRCRDALKDAQNARDNFAEWYSKHYLDPDAAGFKTLEAFQESMAALTGKLLTDLLIPAWRKETESLVLVDAHATADHPAASEKAPMASEAHIRNAEEFVCLVYLGFIQNILGRMRTLVLGIASLFVAVTLSVSTYPFDPRPGLSGTLICLFLVLGAVISLVYAAMHRDSTLSHVTNTTPGELGTEFWFKLIGFGIGPLLGLLTTVFPGLADFFFSWLEPGLASLK